MYLERPLTDEEKKPKVITYDELNQFLTNWLFSNFPDGETKVERTNLNGFYTSLPDFETKCEIMKG